MIESQLGKLNRLRLNASKPELKSWKASTAKLQEAITSLESAGFIDVLPGANIETRPVTDDPVVAKNLPLADEEKLIEKPSPKTTKVPTGLARGIDVPDTWTRHSREKMKDENARLRADKKVKLGDSIKEQALKLSELEKAGIKEEALARGQVDPKKDPEKAARQAKHVADKKAARASRPDKKSKDDKPKASTEVSDDQITIADLARELGREPKIVRSKLRRPKYAEAVAKLRVKGREDWVFPKSAREELLKLVK